MDIMDPLKGAIKTRHRGGLRVISTDMAERSRTAGIHVRNTPCTRGGTLAHGSPLFFHEINIFSAHINHGVLRACMLSATPASADSLLTHGEQDRFSTPTSLVLTFCRNTVEVKDARKE